MYIQDNYIPKAQYRKYATLIYLLLSKCICEEFKMWSREYSVLIRAGGMMSRAQAVSGLEE